MARNKRLSKWESKGITELLNSCDLGAIQLGVHLLKTSGKIINKDFRQALINGFENIKNIITPQRQYTSFATAGQIKENVDRKLAREIADDVNRLREYNSLPRMWIRVW